MGGLYTLYTESAQARPEWHQKLQEAMGLRKVVQESNKVGRSYFDETAFFSNIHRCLKLSP
jgi:hypothetical protein